MRSTCASCVHLGACWYFDTFHWIWFALIAPSQWPRRATRCFEAYTSYERSEVQRVFRAFDEDGSGSLDTEEIEQVMCSFNITPFRSTVEAMQKDIIWFRMFFIFYRLFFGLSCPEVVVLHTFPVVSYLGVFEKVVGLASLPSQECPLYCA